MASSLAATTANGLGDVWMSCRRLTMTFRYAVVAFWKAIPGPDFLPCFKCTSPQRCRPSRVSGPVERPPCIRQRRLPATQGDRHVPPDLVLAPHLGASASQVGCACGTSVVDVIIHPPVLRLRQQLGRHRSRSGDGQRSSAPCFSASSWPLTA